MNDSALPSWPTDSERDCLQRLMGGNAVAWPDVRRRAVDLIAAAVRRLANEVCDRPPAEMEVESVYVPRIGVCLLYHSDRPAGERARSLAVLMEQAEQGQLVTGSQKENLLLDVMTAQAMEMRHNKAAQRFEREHMPRVVALARRQGGERAVDEVENFAAELIVPREGRPPRIAEFRGRTTLAFWLRAVVANSLVSSSRRMKLHGVGDPGDAVDSSEPKPSIEADGHDCERFLQPLFAQVVGGVDAEPRLLLKLLLLDDVPQHRVAAALGIASGNVTRRRQKAVAEMLAVLGRMAAARRAERRVAQCLDAVLAGHDRGVSERLGGVLAAGLAAAPRSITEESV